MGFYVVADEDTVAGFRCAGIPGVVVEGPSEAAEELERLRQEGGQDILITTEQIANSIRDIVQDIRYGGAFPLIVEIPGPEGPGEASPSLMKMIREAVGIRL
ncbi:MAG: V-type ATP synthase subunit F [Planctomycetes bacterium]|nr:V-type ATP synthase subunit F [Planctomycetota bacterium]